MLSHMPLFPAAGAGQRGRAPAVNGLESSRHLGNRVCGFSHYYAWLASLGSARLTDALKPCVKCIVLPYPNLIQLFDLMVLLNDDQHPRLPRHRNTTPLRWGLPLGCI